MTSKVMKILSIMILTVMLVMTATPVFANNEGLQKQGSFTVEQIDYDPDGSKANKTMTDKTGNIMDIIIGVVQVIGIAIAVIMLIFVAIKYLTSAPNDKAEIKKHAVVYVVGAVALFGASGILGIIKDFANQL